MATLILEQNGIRCGGRFNGTVHIGRRRANSLVILDNSISRLHAWIGRQDEHYFIADASSRTGTFVNRERITGRQPLQDGDRIRVGPAEMVFHEGDALPPALLPLKLEMSANVDPGIYIECKCGQLMWADSRLAGRSAECGSCGAAIKIPFPPAGAALIGVEGGNGKATDTPATSGSGAGRNIPRRVKAVCSICQSPITRGDELQVCPDCGVSFHRQCWETNRGCSSYGCPQVNILDKNSVAGAAAGDGDAALAVISHDNGVVGKAFPWEHAILAGSALSIPVGALLFGVPGLIMTLLAAAGLRRTSHRPVIIQSLALGVIALIMGIAVSLFWWFPNTFGQIL